MQVLNIVVFHKPLEKHVWRYDVQPVPGTLIQILRNLMGVHILLVQHSKNKHFRNGPFQILLDSLGRTVFRQR